MRSQAHDTSRTINEAAAERSAFGRALSVRLAEADSARPTEEAAATSPQLISPELALVDPELARAARALLPERAPTPEMRRVTPTRPLPAVVQPVARKVLEAPPPGRGPRRASLLGLAALVLAGGALAGVLLSDWATPQVERGATPTATPRHPITSTAVTVPPATTSSVPSETTPASTTPARTAPRATRPVPAPGGRTFAWAPARDAAAYEFQLFRGAVRVFRARVAEPRLVLPERWRRNGRADSLQPGSYRWYVWVISRRTGRQAPAALVQAQLVVE
jgi:hypothetical protein